ncbi:hypothetical protein BP6252_04469 [Coleophoma cylindrospora]|uniref:Heterokaryon incompatibility domain-containing protein n=1 Tax=Coleophoma cylindrospora TaxID=1849047 RepID=A0A3D8S173_9HELO|nr:hypothetical protein BP6252_04469 [Coleophoma cylindrospora]
MYSRLPSGSRTIRLAVLKPGSARDIVTCTLHEHSLGVKLQYKALSYAWDNNPSYSRLTMVCNGQDLEVPSNLYLALRRIRHIESPLTLWVDTLCINQADNDERNHQVGMMREIYENSEEVVIWLGEKEAAGRLAAQKLDQVGALEFYNLGQRRIEWCSKENNDDVLKVRCYTQVFENSKNMTFSLADIFGADTFGDGSVDIFGAFCLIYQLAQGVRSVDIAFYRHITWAGGVVRALWAIMDLPWWRRTWVVQETVVARKATIYYSNFTAPWTMFSMAARNFVKDRISDNLDLFGSQLTRDPLVKFSRTILDIESTRSDWETLQRIELRQILRKFRSREASDKRDKVFALLGLIRYWEDGATIYPDYTLTVEQVFWRTTISMISSAKSLSVLAGTLQDRNKISSSRPSWVVDWSEPPQTGEFDRLNRLSMYDAAAGLSGAVLLHGNLILEGRGIFVDIVTSVGEKLPRGQVSRIRMTVAKWLNLLQPRNWNQLPQPSQSRNAQVKLENTAYPLGGSCENAFWRTLCADVLHVSKSEAELNAPNLIYRRADDSGYAAFRAWSAVDEGILRRRTSIVDGQWTHAAEPQVVNENKNSFHYALESATSSRSFFVTEKGYMGTGPSSIQQGDYVCVLLGSSVPFILRQSPEPRICVSERLRVLVTDPAGKLPALTCSQTHSRCYSLIGDAYLHGIMDGIVVQASPTVTPKSVYLI